MQTKFTKWLSMLLVVCMLCSLAVPALAANDYTATLSGTTMTEDGSITVTFNTEADANNYYVIEVADSTWSTRYVDKEEVKSGTSYTISGLSAGSYYVYIAYYKDGKYSSDALSTTSITVTDGSSTSNPTASLDSTTMTESGSITVTFTQEASTTAYYKIEIAPDESGSWGTKILEETVTSGTTFTIDKTTVSALTAGSTYHIYIGYWESTTWKSDALADTTFTVTEDGGGTHNYQLSVALDDSKLEKDEEDNPIYPYVYSSDDTTVNVTVTVTENGEAVTSLASNYDIYIWIDYPAGGKNDVAITGSSLGSDGTITGAINLTDTATFSGGFTTGVDYNVYARVNYDSAEVDGSMVGTSFTINTTYSMELALDEDKYDSVNDYYVYDFNDTINAAASFILTIDGTPETAVTTVPTGTKLTIWYGYGVDSDGDGVLDSWADILFDSGSYITTSAGSGNTGTITVSPGNFEAGTVYKVYAGLYNEGGEQLAYAEVPFIVKQASFYTRTLTLDGDVGVNYYVDMTGVDEDDMSNYSVKFTVGTTETTAAFNSGSYRDDFNGETKYYRFTVTLDSTQMATEFTAELQYGGTTIQTDTYSVESYCKWAITNSKDEKDLCAALLNYGGYSQTYFNKNTENLANANLSTYFSTAGGTWTDPVQATFTADLSSYTTTTSGTIPSEITDGSFSASLVLGSQTVIRIYFNASDTTGLTVKVGEEELDIQTAASDDYGYYVEYEVQASKLGSTIEFTISGGTDTGTVSYSAYAYIYSTLGDTHSAYDADESLVNVCKALYYYGEAAKEYSNWYKGTT